MGEVQQPAMCLPLNVMHEQGVRVGGSVLDFQTSRNTEARWVMQDGVAFEDARSQKPSLHRRGNVRLFLHACLHPFHSLTFCSESLRLSLCLLVCLCLCACPYTINNSFHIFTYITAGENDIL